MSVPLRWQDCNDYSADTNADASPEKPKLSPRRAARRVASVRTLLIGIALGVLLSVAAMSATRALGGSSTATLPLQPVAAVSPLKVTLQSASLTRHLGYATVTATAVNTGKHRLNGVEAVIELLDDRQNPVQVESALLPVDALPGGGSVPFQVEMRDDAHATSFRVNFRQLTGIAAR